MLYRTASSKQAVICCDGVVTGSAVRLGKALALALGFNIEPTSNLPAAVKLLARFGYVRAVSSVWETEPVGFADQPKVCQPPK